MFVFAYGTLVLPEIRDRVLGHPVETTDAVLHGYTKVCGWDYLTLVPSDSSVRGVLFEADERDVERMDVWEDVPVYELVPVSVETATASRRRPRTTCRSPRSTTRLAATDGSRPSL